ncbi:MAG: hypothetical protein AVO35_01750 [Candidatus Aegiribacteria sp. MLS_C]|nr:MAG: hypothetical protein AVO35_01750 [Candidatus Aegiribacteria sp. MLS_C]
MTGGISRRLESITPGRLTFVGVLVLLAGTVVYFLFRFYFPPITRYLFFGGAAFLAVFFLRPYPSFWMLAMPTVFMAGGATIPFGDFNPAVATIALFGFTLFFVADRLLWNRPLFVPSRPLFWLFAALAVQVCSIFISIHIIGQYHVNAVREGFGLYLFIPMAVMVPVLCSDDDRMLLVLRAVVVALLAASAIGVAQYFSITEFSRVDMGLGYVYRGRVSSLFGSGNIFAGYLELTIPLAVALLFRDRSAVWKAVSLTAALLGMLSVLYTFSRGGLVSVFLGVGLTLMYIFRSRPWIPVVIGALAVLLLVQNADTFERQMSFFVNPQEQITQPTILHRYVSYRGFVQQIRESPIFGVGWGAREHFWGRSRLYSFWEVRHVVSTGAVRLFGGLNSLFFNQAVKGGAVGLLSVLMMFAAVYSAFLGAMRRSIEKVVAVAATAGIFSFMVHLLVDSFIIFPTVNSAFWISVGILLTALARGREEPSVST